MKRGWLEALAMGGAACLGDTASLRAQRGREEGAGRFPLRDAGICFATAPSAEDRFSASELASIVAARTNIRLVVAESGCGARPILFRRTGNGGDLAVPGETPGRDSREAYSISITPAAVRLESRSS